MDSPAAYSACLMIWNEFGVYGHVRRDGATPQTAAKEVWEDIMDGMTPPCRYPSPQHQQRSLAIAHITARAYLDAVSKAASLSSHQITIAAGFCARDELKCAIAVTHYEMMPINSVTRRALMKRLLDENFAGKD
ncbi:hypothetical protein [Tistrella mobilis]|uniref:hypothetical protein n=1 Tax=Tistrella mobilis TaxID=171437 RepID=UPI0005A07855|nr:hypothetical protein [Tistrella mobilis]